MLQEMEHGPHVIEGSRRQIVMQLDGEGQGGVIVEPRAVPEAGQHGGKIVVMVSSYAILEDGHADEAGTVWVYLFGVGRAVEDVIEGYEGK